MSRTLVVGDIHGARKALDQVLERSEFTDEDTLICLGDVCDGWHETRQCIDRLLEIPNLIYILGNHDAWAWEWMRGSLFRNDFDLWWHQGGRETALSYSIDNKVAVTDVPEEHVEFFRSACLYYHNIERNYLFVHGGFNWKKPIEEQHYNNFLWDRQLWETACAFDFKDSHLSIYKEIYIGHTNNLDNRPIKRCNVWNLDSGGGWGGFLSIMDIDTKQYWTSDRVRDLYPHIKGRGG